jgi:hypothetical protein
MSSREKTPASVPIPAPPSASASSSKQNGKRKISNASRSTSPPLKKDFHWLDDGLLTDKTTMSFDVAPLDLITESVQPKATTESESDKDKQNQLDVRIRVDHLYYCNYRTRPGY